MNKEFLQKTIDFWQPYSEEKLTEEDAREIIGNLTGFFNLLHELNMKYNRGKK